MATSGSVDSGGYQGRVLRFSWGTNSVSGNTRNIWYKVEAIGGSSSMYYHHNDTVDINGVNVYAGSDSHAVYTGDVLASGNMDIDQNNTTAITVHMYGGIYVKSNNINTSQSWTLDTLIQAPSINSLALKSRTINSLTFNFTCSKADDWYYKLSSQSSWTQGSTSASTKGVTSGEFTISNLEPNKSYNINFKVRNWAGTEAKDTDKNDISGTTYDIGKISSVNNFEHGNSVSLIITNPSNSSLNLAMKIGNAQILNKSINVGTNAINFSDTELDNIYKLYGSSNTLTATFILTTAGTYTNSKTATITLTGNQKTAYVTGKKRAKVYVGVNGTVKKAVIWIGNNGKKRCI